MKILITGVTGLVGRTTAHLLEASTHSVRAALRAPREDLRYESIVMGGIESGADWSRALRGVEVVVHLAARVHIMNDDTEGAVDFHRVNTDGTLRLAQAAAASGTKRFIYVSTIKVNGEATTGRPFRADDEPRPGDAYAHSKLAAERGLLEIDGMETVIIRPPLIHGPGAKGNLARFCRLACSGLPVPLGSIVNRRDLVGAENLAHLIERCVWHPAAVGEVFLVSDGVGLSTPELYRLIAEGLGQRPRIVNIPVPLLRSFGRALGFGAEIDRLTQSLELDISKTRERLGWNPPVSAAAGIADMARAFASQGA